MQSLKDAYGLRHLFCEGILEVSLTLRPIRRDRMYQKQEVGKKHKQEENQSSSRLCHLLSEPWQARRAERNTQRM
jgi:hypothetical protein